TKVITAVDYGGNPVELDKIINLAKKHGIKVIDDASHALGSVQNGVKVGVKADISIFSFHPVKPITTLEGGALATNDDELARLARLYRSHGIAKTKLWDSDLSLPGYNYWITEVAFAFGLSQLKRLVDVNPKTNETTKFYDEEFSGCENII
ncbi:DegT/DnrJ/EryC1/StrS family aminotransferase, partial [Campylobacter concisus]|uniref:DegT/DnrJ/EryC1/StrS family aminotransferase n=1 Tax=Campylobacter concisus TaxID=199 RepID=UPI0015E1B029